MYSIKSPVIQLPRQKPNNYDNGPECVVNGAMALVLHVSRCAGAAAFKATAAGAGWRISVSTPLVILQYIFMTLLNIFALAALTMDFLEEPGKRRRVGETTFAAFLWISDLALAMLIASLVIYSEPVRMKNLLRVLKQLQQINVKLNNDPSTKTEKIKIIMVICILAFTIVLQATNIYQRYILSVDDVYNWLIDVLYYCSYKVAHLQGLLATLQWGCTALTVHAAAAALNQHLLRLRYGSESTASSSQLQATIRRFAQSHEQLGKVMKQMNSNDGAIVLAMLMASFLRLVAIAYYIYFYSYSGEGIMGVIVMALSATALHLSILLVIVEPCHLTHKQRETTKFLLGHLISHLGPRCERVSKELYSFATQIRLTEDIKFMPLGVYVLNRPLLATILGGVITYLIIVLQHMSSTRTDHI